MGFLVILTNHKALLHSPPTIYLALYSLIRGVSTDVISFYYPWSTVYEEFNLTQYLGTGDMLVPGKKSYGFKKSIFVS